MSHLCRGPGAHLIHRAIRSKVGFSMGLVCSEVEVSWLYRQLPASTGSDGQALLGEQWWRGG